MSNIRIEYNTQSLHHVIGCYAGDFKPIGDGVKMVDFPKWIIDPFKGVVLFVLRSAEGDNHKETMIDVKIDTVVYAFAKKLFEVPDCDGVYFCQGEWSTGEKITKIEWFVDPVRDKVVYRVFVNGIEEKL